MIGSIFLTDFTQAADKFFVYVEILSHICVWDVLGHKIISIRQQKDGLHDDLFPV